jgi:pyruvate,water dikinase
MKFIAQGIPASKGIAEGFVRVVKSTDQIKDVTKNDVILITFDHALLAVAIMKSKGVIAMHGGVTAHAAIIARECGIPCITGVKSINLKTGDRVLIDGKNGKIFKK